MGVTIFVLGGLALCGAGLLLFGGGIIFLILTLKGLFDTKKIHIPAIISVCIGEILFVPLSFAVVVGPLHMLFFEEFVMVLICVIASCALITAGITLFAVSASRTKKEGQRPLRLFIPAVILFCMGIYFGALFGLILSLYPNHGYGLIHFGKV